VGGEYATPGFPPSEFMGTAGKKGKARVKKEQPSLKNLGYQKVRVKERCSKFPYCNQSPEAIEFYNESRVLKTIKKGNLKIKK
jgi:DNA replicative helicase MCM subunit Mcm2 (Cdc46/Mcm family)